MLRRLVDGAGVASAVGLTLSPSQARWIAGSPRAEIEALEEDWRVHRPKKRYDAIVSVGAFEHFVQKGLEPARKLAAYREFFALCDGLLTTGGGMSLQTIAYSEPHEVHPLQEETFPESDLPLFWEPLAAAEGRFQLVAVRNDGDDYVRTLQMWEQSLLDHHDEAVALVGDAATAKFRRYLRLSAVGFRIGMVGLLRMSFVKKY
ncbi:MAG: cyclopropane-fatty-acyl-phospholipid synthase [Tardiphaga sp.]|nr:cyclopropane-fatty-acyl-phospholipid synthase [Tardiphaga sp.]